MSIRIKRITTAFKKPSLAACILRIALIKTWSTNLYFSLSFLAFFFFFFLVTIKKMKFPFWLKLFTIQVRLENRINHSTPPSYIFFFTKFLQFKTYKVLTFKALFPSITFLLEQLNLPHFFVFNSKKTTFSPQANQATSACAFYCPES